MSAWRVDLHPITSRFLKPMKREHIEYVALYVHNCLGSTNSAACTGTVIMKVINYVIL